MNPIVTGDQRKDSYTIMCETVRILTMCDTLKKTSYTIGGCSTNPTNR